MVHQDEKFCSMLIFLRFLSVAVGVTNATLFFVQATHADGYPWIVIGCPILFLFAGCLTLWKRRRDAKEFWVLLPSCIALIACGYGLLLTEGSLATLVIPIFAGLLSVIVLELLFLSSFLPARYPANGLSYANLALVPPTLWLLSFTSVGLTVFINASRLVPILVLGFACFLLFYATSHAEANASSRMRWGVIGSWVGLQVGMLGAILPVNLIVHGAISALCVSFALRVRRYEHAPVIRRSAIVTESVAICLFLALVLATSRWV